MRDIFVRFCCTNKACKSHGMVIVEAVSKRSLEEQMFNKQKYVEVGLTVSVHKSRLLDTTVREHFWQYDEMGKATDGRKMGVHVIEFKHICRAERSENGHRELCNVVKGIL